MDILFPTLFLTFIFWIVPCLVLKWFWVKVLDTDFESKKWEAVAQISCLLLAIMFLLGILSTGRFFYREIKIQGIQADAFYSRKDEAVKTIYRSKLPKEDQEKAILLIKKCSNEPDFNYLMTLILKEDKK